MNRLEDQTWMKPNMSENNMLPKKRQRPEFCVESAKTENLLFCTDKCQETSFNPIANAHPPNIKQGTSSNDFIGETSRPGSDLGKLNWEILKV